MITISKEDDNLMDFFSKDAMRLPKFFTKSSIPEAQELKEITFSGGFVLHPFEECKNSYRLCQANILNRRFEWEKENPTKFLNCVDVKVKQSIEKPNNVIMEAKFIPVTRPLK